MIKISPPFEEAPLFAEPTNAEISRTADNIPVFSFRPEDLPNYKASARDYTPQDKSLRRMALAKKILAFDPSYRDMNLRQIYELASSHSTGVHTRLVFSRQIATPDLFILRRPSLREESRDIISSFTGIAPSSLTPHIPQEILRFLAVHAEVGHMLQIVHNPKYPNTFREGYHSALYAEAHALNEFNQVAQSLPYRDQLLKSFIAMKALASLTIAPPRSWLAPALDKMFFEKGNEFLKTHNPEDIYKSYIEIRLRTAILADNQAAAAIALQLGVSIRATRETLREKNEIALASSSAYLHAAMNLWDNGEFNKIYELDEEVTGSNHFLAGFIPRLWNIRETPAYIHQLQNGDIFNLLQDVYVDGNIDEDTRNHIGQILDGARLFCPEIAPQHQPIERTRMPSGNALSIGKGPL